MNNNVRTLLTYTHLANRINNDNAHSSVKNIYLLFIYIFYHHYVTTRKSVIA